MGRLDVNSVSRMIEGIFFFNLSLSSELVSFTLVLTSSSAVANKHSPYLHMA